jgi:hypothetical protein
LLKANQLNMGGIIIGIGLIVGGLYGIVKFRDTVRGNQARRARQEVAAGIGDAIRAELEAGRIPIANPSTALLRPGESALIAVPAYLLENVTVGYKSEGSSVRLRIAKGVSVGSYSGHSHAVKQMRRTSKGEFVVTSSRVIFAGDAKSFEAQINRLTNVEIYSDAVALHQGATTHLVGFDARQLAAMSGTIVKSVAEGKLPPPATAKVSVTVSRGSKPTREASASVRSERTPIDTRRRT